MQNVKWFAKLDPTKVIQEKQVNHDNFAAFIWQIWLKNFNLDQMLEILYNGP